MNENNKPIFPSLVPGSEEENLKKQEAYYERALDGFVFFLEQTGSDFHPIKASSVGSKQELWATALDSIFDIAHARWDPEHAYLIAETDPEQFSSAEILHPFIHEYFKGVFGEEYMILPYSTEYVIVTPMMDPDEILEGYRQDLEENPEEHPLSNNIYLVSDGVMSVYSDTQDEDFIPIVLEDPEEKEKKLMRKQRRKQHGKQQIHYLM